MAEGAQPLTQAHLGEKIQKLLKIPRYWKLTSPGPRARSSLSELARAFRRRTIHISWGKRDYEHNTPSPTRIPPVGDRPPS